MIVLLAAPLVLLVCLAFRPKTTLALFALLFVVVSWCAYTPPAAQAPAPVAAGVYRAGR